MVDLITIGENQYRDEKTGLRFPWFTKPFLDELSTWDMSKENVFIYGIGADVLWFQKKCKAVYGVDEKFDWVQTISDVLIACGENKNVELKFCPDKQHFINSIRYFKRKFGIIVVDGDYWRDECIKEALDHLKEDGKLIVDNWCQEEVYLPNNETYDQLINFRIEVYKQPTHATWVTAVFTKIK